MGKLGEILSHPHELPALVRIYLAHQRATKLPTDPDLAFCYGMLNSVSRSFAVVIQQLPHSLRDAICVFYLVLRGLDTVEDDMALDDKIKLPMLLAFHDKIYQKGFTMDCGYKHYKRLMAQFDTVVRVFLNLEPGFQDVIADITRRMGEGMAEFIQRDVVTLDDFDKYCHYVAGLVGIGLSQLFASSGLESKAFANKQDLANHMGLFLQKTNIIRDYLMLVMGLCPPAYSRGRCRHLANDPECEEDIMEEPRPRMFWPHEIWGNYGTTLDDFKEPSNRAAAVRCLNHMVVDALQHLPYCIKYMQGLRDTQVFRFCAIPQIMAAGTLSLCYNNGKVFEGVVKMRRGQTALVFDHCSNMGDLFRWFLKFLEMLQDKVRHVASEDPTREEAQHTISSHIELCWRSLAKWEADNAPPFSYITWAQDLTAVAVAGLYAYVAFGLGSGLQHSVPLQLQPAVSKVQQLVAAHKELASFHVAAAALLLLFTLRTAVLKQR